MQMVWASIDKTKCTVYEFACSLTLAVLDSGIHPLVLVSTVNVNKTEKFYERILWKETAAV